MDIVSSESSCNQPAHIGLAAGADAPAITVVINDAFRVAENFFVDHDRIDAAEVEKLFKSGRFLIARTEDRVLGCVYVEPKETIPPRAYLGLLSVDPNQQRAGVGSMLMDAAEDYCRSLGCKFMDIRMVNLRADLPSYYQKRGYVETGLSAFPADIATKIPCHFIEMSKPL